MLYFVDAHGKPALSWPEKEEEWIGGWGHSGCGRELLWGKDGGQIVTGLQNKQTNKQASKQAKRKSELPSNLSHCHWKLGSDPTKLEF